MAEKAKQEAAAIEQSVKALEKRATLMGLDKKGTLAFERDETIKGLAGNQAAIDRVTAAYGKLIAAEEKTISLGDRIRNAVSNPMQAVANGWESLIGKLGTGGVVLGTVVATVGLLSNKLLDLVASQGRAAEQTINLADRLDITSGKAEQLQAMAEIAGVNIGVLEGSSRLLSQALEDGSGAGEKQIRALERLNISTTSAAGGSRDMGRVLVELLEKLSGVSSASERMRIANETLGRGAKELIPLIKNYGDLKATVEALGVGVDQELTAKLARADDELGVLAKRWDLFKKSLAGEVGVPALEFINSTLQKFDEIRRARREEEQRGIQAANEFLITPTELGTGQRASLEKMSKSATEFIGASIKRGRQLSEQYKEERLNVATLEGINARLTILRKEQSDRERDLSSGKLLDSAFLRTRADLNKAQAEIAGLEGRKQAIQDAPAAAKRAEDEQHRLFELRRKFGSDLDKFQAKQFSDRMSQIVEVGQAEIEQTRNVEGERTRIREDIFRESETASIEAMRRREDLELRGMATSRDVQLRQLDQAGARTIEQKVALEERKAQIEIEYLERSNAKNEEMLQRRSELAIQGRLTEARIVGATDEQIASIRYNLEAKLQQDLLELRTEKESTIAATRDSASIRSAQIIQDAHQRAFDQVRNSFESLLDQMFGRTKSWGDAMKSIFTASLLTPVKQMASQYFAALVTGQRGAAGGGNNAGGAGGGILGRLMGGFGSSGGGGVPIFGAGSITGGPGGTGGFSGPVGALTGGGSGRVGLTSALGIGGGLGGSLKDLAFNRGSINMGGYSTTAAGIGGIKGGLAGFASSPVGAIGGGLLAMNGLRQGGIGGLAQTTAGGALLGFQFGGPIGAAIGAGVGAVAGFVRLFMKGAESKVIEKVRALYGLKLDKSFARQIVDMSKQGFGGNLDLALRAPQVRDLLELYAMSTGQKWGGASATPIALSLSQSGGSIFQNASYRNGSALPSLGGSIPLMGASPTASQMAPASTTTILQLDADATRQVLEGRATEVIQSNPRLVGNANQQATKASVGRRESAASLLGTPGLITT